MSDDVRKGAFAGGNLTGREAPLARFEGFSLRQPLSAVGIACWRQEEEGSWGRQRLPAAPALVYGSSERPAAAKAIVFALRGRVLGARGAGAPGTAGEEGQSVTVVTV